jgi:glycosyltransferase involved in cell wall biosynthesis
VKGGPRIQASAEPSRARRVCLFISGLQAAGAERVLSFLANAWSRKGWQVTLLTLEARGVEPFYPLDGAVVLRRLDLQKDSRSLGSAVKHNLERIRVLRRAIRAARPEVLIAFADRENVLAILATRGLGCPVIISERTDPSRRSLGRIWDAIRNLAYPWADRIVFQSQGILDWFPPRVRNRGLVIPNPVPGPPPGGPQAPGAEPGRVVGLGRLYPVKGFEVLVRAFAAAGARVPHWQLEVWGEGPERGALERLAGELGMADRIRFPGITQDAYAVLRSADLFVLPSHVEGFPNALLEAMACGLPVVSTRFGGAAADIVQDGVDGLLVPPGDPEAMAEAMVQLMLDPQRRARLGGRAEAVVERFSAERVLALWETAVAQAVS